MKLLALETSTEWCSVALWHDGRCAWRDVAAGQRHSELLPGLVDAVLGEAGCTLSVLDGLAFGSGPGSFTGLRIACGYVQGLALGLDRPVLPVGSLRVLAAELDPDETGRRLACLDARMGEVYLAAWEAGRCVIEPCLGRPENLPLPEGEGWLAAGSGLDVANGLLARRLGEGLRQGEAGLRPRAERVAALAASALARGEGVPGEQALPIYVRDKVAATVAERQVARQ